MLCVYAVMRVEVFLKDKFLKVLFLGERNYIHLGFVFFFETGFHCVAQAGLKLLILLPLPPTAGIIGMNYSAQLHVQFC
jgi:hypothetical protein